MPLFCLQREKNTRVILFLSQRDVTRGTIERMLRALYRIYMQHVRATFTKIKRVNSRIISKVGENSWYFFFFFFSTSWNIFHRSRVTHTRTQRVKIISTGSRCIDVNLKKMEGRRESSSAYPSRQVNYHLSNVPISVQVCITRRGGGKENDTMENRASDIKDIYLASGRGERLSTTKRRPLAQNTEFPRSPAFFIGGKH